MRHEASLVPRGCPLPHGRPQQLAIVTLPPLRFAPLGDRALVATLGERADDETFARVRAALAQLAGSHPAVRDVVAGYTSVTVHYEPAAVLTHRLAPHATLARELEALLAGAAGGPPLAPRVVEIPVCYERELAPDLADVAAHTGLEPAAVIGLHTGATYTVRMIGFLPGFPYLAGLDPRLATPRRAEPRTRVPAGSVGIGGAQTGVYPLASPGGWRLIGRTPLRLFDPRRERAALLAVGDRLRFRAVDRAEYDRLAGS